MPANQRYFLDSNVLIYALGKPTTKSRIALELCRKAIETGLGTISTQVILETANNLVNKFGQSHSDVAETLENFLSLEVFCPTAKDLIQSITFARKHKVSLFDALIVLAAVQTKCKVLYTEDLTHGQTLEGVKIINPFTEA